MGQATAGVSGGVWLSGASVLNVPRGLHDWELNRLLESKAKTSAPLLITCWSGGGSGPREHAVMQWTPGDRSHLGGHSRPGRGLLLMTTLGLCPPAPGIFRHRTAKKVHPPTEEPPGRRCQDPCSKLTDCFRYTVGSPVFHFNVFLKKVSQCSKCSTETWKHL